LVDILDRLDKDIQKIDTLQPTVMRPATGLEYIESNERSTHAETDPFDDTWLESDDEQSGVIEILLSRGESPNRCFGGESTWEIYEQLRVDKQQGPNEV
jgi:hypothetical protein